MPQIRITNTPMPWLTTGRPFIKLFIAELKEMKDSAKVKELKGEISRYLGRAEKMKALTELATKLPMPPTEDPR